MEAWLPAPVSPLAVAGEIDGEGSRFSRGLRPAPLPDREAALDLLDHLVLDEAEHPALDHVLADVGPVFEELVKVPGGQDAVLGQWGAGGLEDLLELPILWDWQLGRVWGAVSTSG